jgi:predicted MFS family arabinose efflux permease
MNPPATLSPTPASERFLLWVLAAVQFTHIVDFMVMMPLGPQLTKLFGLTDARFGLLVSAYTLAAGASGLLGVFFIDRFERKRLMLFAYAGFGLSTLACGLAPTYGSLMLARIAAGACGGLLSASVQTIIADTVPFERRGRAMGIVMSAFSLSTVAGVPASLWLASHHGWNAPFVGIAIAALLVWAGAAAAVPRIDGHLRAHERRSPAQTMAAVLREPNHLRAFALSSTMLMSSFCIIPYITIYTTTNVGMTMEQIPLIYLVGGVATFFSSRLWGWAADRYGKVAVFRVLAVLALAPMLTLTHLPVVPLALVLVVTTLFFVLVSGRMVPGMALIASASAPQSRGAFMSLNGAVQSAAMGVASYVGGLLISRTVDGQVAGYGNTGWLALACTLAAFWLVARVRHD